MTITKKTGLQAAFAIAILCPLAPSAVGGIIFDIETDNTPGPLEASRNISGNTLTITTNTLTADGVDFVAELTAVVDTVTGGTRNIQLAGGGIGAQGGSGSNTLNTSAGGGGDERVQFSVDILSEIGGTVSFDGFTSAVLVGLVGTETADVNGSSLTDVSGVDLSVAPFSTPTSLSIVAEVGGFRVDSVGLQFSGTAAATTAVPEPSSVALLGIGALSCVAYRRRRNRAGSDSQS